MFSLLQTFPPTSFFQCITYIFSQSQKLFQLPLIDSVQQQQKLTVEIIICSIELIWNFFSRSFNMTVEPFTYSKNCCFKPINTLKKTYSGIILIFISLCPQINLFLTVEKSQHLLLSENLIRLRLKLRGKRPILSCLIKASGSPILISSQYLS